MRVHLSLQSRNVKTGPIPVSTTSEETCWSGCAFFDNGCYAKLGHVAMHWKKVSEGQRGDSWNTFVAAVASLPNNQYGNVWRHNQAGDLPGTNHTLDTAKLDQLVKANTKAGMRGFTYTHKPLRQTAERTAIKAANANGFTINLSGNNLAHADALANLDIGPVVTVLPADVHGHQTIHTPAGRRVVVCPATYRDDVTCASCRLCAVATRKTVVGFPAHGQSKAKASAVASGE